MKIQIVIDIIEDADGILYELNYPDEMYGNLLALIVLLLVRIEAQTSSILDEILKSRDKERDDFNPLKREEFRKVSYINYFLSLSVGKETKVVTWQTICPALRSILLTLTFTHQKFRSESVSKIPL